MKLDDILSCYHLISRYQDCLRSFRLAYSDYSLRMVVNLGNDRLNIDECPSGRVKFSQVSVFEVISNPMKKGLSGCGLIPAVQLFKTFLNFNAL